MNMAARLGLWFWVVLMLVIVMAYLAAWQDRAGVQVSGVEVT